MLGKVSKTQARFYGAKGLDPRFEVDSVWGKPAHLFP